MKERTQLFAGALPRPFGEPSTAVKVLLSPALGRDGWFSSRYRRDVLVRDEERVLTHARRLFLELNPDETPERAAELVTDTVDAIHTVLEYAGILGAGADGRLASAAPVGLTLGGSRSALVTDEADPLLAGANCFRPDDVFGLPPGS